jgi:hypothetical protein
VGASQSCEGRTKKQRSREFTVNDSDGKGSEPDLLLLTKHALDRMVLRISLKYCVHSHLPSGGVSVSEVCSLVASVRTDVRKCKNKRRP